MIRQQEPLASERMWHRSSLLSSALGALALALAGCGGDKAELIPQQDADVLSALVGEAGEASSAGECERARRAVAEAGLQLAGLPRKTDKQLKANLKQWLEHVDKRIAADCKPPKPERTATPDPTATATPTPTPTPTATATATPTPTPTPTATTDSGDDEGAEEPAGTGGVPDGDG